MSLHDQIQAIQKAFRRSGRELVLSSGQALFRGILILSGAIISQVFLYEDLSHHIWVWGIVFLLICATEGVAYLRLAKSDSEKFMTGLERQLLKYLLMVLAVGVVLSVALCQQDAANLLPGVWMLMIGLAYMSVGLFSFSSTWVMGMASCLGGTITLFSLYEYRFIVLGLVLGVGSILWSFVLRTGEMDVE